MTDREKAMCCLGVCEGITIANAVSLLPLILLTIYKPAVATTLASAIVTTIVGVCMVRSMRR